MAFVNTADLIGDEALVASIVDGSITEYVSDRVTSIGFQALVYCTNLVRVRFPNVTKIGINAFSGCSAVQEADFTALTHIDTNGLSGCASLLRLVLRNTTTVCKTEYNLKYTLVSNGGYIYVPSALIEGYKTATDWADCVDNFRALEDYTVDGTTTGALDPNKI